MSTVPKPKKEQTLKARVCDTTLKALKKAAAEEGLTVSDMIRRAIRVTYKIS